MSIKGSVAHIVLQARQPWPVAQHGRETSSQPVESQPPYCL
ncbi:MAG: hypothetical protein QW096_13490 [Thermofilaceae archaeon]